MLETSLYPAVKRFLETAGFRVKGEVNGCDAVAVQDGEPQRLAIVEMKRGFNLDLLLQAVERMRIADEVWLAVPATRRGRDRDPRVRRLCRLIGFGLIPVDVARNRRGTGGSRTVSAAAGPAPPFATAQRAWKARRRSITGRFLATTYHDRLQATGSYLRCVATGGPRPPPRSSRGRT